MRDPWLPVATKGCFALDVLTERRAFAERILLLDCRYLLRVTPDDSDAFDMRSPNAASAASFVHEMQPHTLRILVAEGEDEEAVRAAIEGRMQ